VFVLLLLLLTGCTKKSAPEPTVAQVSGKFLVITAEPGMNNNSAVTIDIVQAKDVYVWEQLIKLTAAEYFTRKNDIIDKKIRVWSIDVLDKFWVERFELQGYTPEGVGVVLFANYTNAGPKTRCMMNLACDCTKLNLGKDHILEAQSTNTDLSGAKLVAERAGKR